jgi:hypothetical protein
MLNNGGSRNRPKGFYILEARDSKDLDLNNRGKLEQNGM